ncbi:MAG: hypothetical protein AABX32_02105, partial [Nanoarchaeota archaeon]
NGSHGIDTAQANLNPGTNVLFTNNLFSYSLPAGKNYDDIVGFGMDDDGNDRGYVFFRDGTAAFTLDLGATSFNQNVAFTAGTSTYTLPAGFNVSDIIGFSIDTTQTGNATAFFRNGSYLVSEGEIHPFSFTISYAYTIPSDFNSADSIGVIYDSGSNDFGMFFRNRSIVTNTNVLAFNNDIPLTGVVQATYHSDQNLTTYTNITLQTRISNDTVIWTPWSNLYYIGDGSEVVQDDFARYIQYKANFKTPSPYKTPYLENVSINYTVDLIAPAVNASINNTAPRYNDVVNISTNASDLSGLSGCQFIDNQSSGAKRYFNITISGENDKCSQNFTISLFRGNVINFTVIVNDTFNNKNQSEFIITVANTPPNAAVLSLPLSGNISFNETTLNWTNGTDIDNDALTHTVFVSKFYDFSIINQSSVEVDQNYTTQNLTDGIWFWIVNVSDGFDTAQSAIRNFTIDETGPNITLIMPLNASFSAESNVNFTFNVSDHIDVANCSLYIIDAGNSVLLPPVNKSVNKSITQKFQRSLGDGIYPWFINCTDVFGLQETSVVFSVTVDTVAPTVVLTAPANNTWDIDGNVQMSYTLTDNNPSACQLYKNDSGTWILNQTDSTPISGTNSFNVTPLRDGHFIWNVFCNDSAGFSDWGGSTISLNENFTIKVDTQPPKLNFTGPTPSNDTNTTLTTITINVTYQENNSDTIIFDFNGTLRIKSYTASENFTNETYTNLQGVYRFNVTINDSAGQINKTETRIVRVDSIAPSLFLESPAGTSYNTDGFVIFKYNASDATLGIKNCSLSIDGIINITNNTVTEGISQNFTKFLQNGTYNWSIECIDYVSNVNISETRNITVDTTIPFLRNESVNVTLPTNVQENVCLYVIANDTFSGVDTVRIKVKKPVSGLTDSISLSNSSTSCASGGYNWSTTFLNNEVGKYIWNITNITDKAGNFNATSPDKKVNWSAQSIFFLNVTFIEPVLNFEINESEVSLNYSFVMTCNVSCRPDSSGSCNDVTLMAEYNNESLAPTSWFSITTKTTQLINKIDNLSCGNLNNIAPGNYCNQTFNISTGISYGNSNFSLRCSAISSNAPYSFSDLFVNGTVNDHPFANFTYPQNGSFLNNIEILNASSSYDDQNLSMFIFELDDNIGFSSPSLLCNNNQSNCTFNTLTQTQCQEDSWSCYIRLNVTDNDNLKNSTIIQIQIDNTNPTVRLEKPLNSTWSNSASNEFNYTAFDTNLDACTLYHNESGIFTANETNTTVANNTYDIFTVNLKDGNFIWNVLCNDTAG